MKNLQKIKNYKEDINHTIIHPEDLKWFIKQNIWKIAWVITFWDEKNVSNIIWEWFPSIFSNSWYWNDEGRFIDIWEQWPLHLFTIKWAEKIDTWKYKNIVYSESGEFLIWSIEFLEKSWDSGDVLIENSRKAYEEIYELMQKTWKINFARIWNYVTNILWETEITIDNKKVKTNRYQAFCTGRSEAFDELFKLENKDLPTATWIWNHYKTKWLKIFFVATNRTDIQNHINPHQTNPADYSKQKYWIEGISWKKSLPKFNRSTTLGNKLFVWWTASILWEDAENIWDIVKQTELSLQNMLYTMQEASKNTGVDFTKHPIVLKVFVKRKDDFDIIKAVIENEKLNPLPNTIIETVYTYWTVCRDEWLVEVSCETIDKEIAKIILERKIDRLDSEKNELLKKQKELLF